MLADLLSRFVQGDEAAFEQLFRQFEAEVYRWDPPDRPRSQRGR